MRPCGRNISLFISRHLTPFPFRWAFSQMSYGFQMANKRVSLSTDFYLKYNTYLTSPCIHMQMEQGVRGGLAYRYRNPATFFVFSKIWTSKSHNDPGSHIFVSIPIGRYAVHGFQKTSVRGGEIFGQKVASAPFIHSAWKTSEERHKFCFGAVFLPSGVRYGYLPGQKFPRSSPRLSERRYKLRK